MTYLFSYVGKLFSPSKNKLPQAASDTGIQGSIAFDFVPQFCYKDVAWHAFLSAGSRSSTQATTAKTFKGSFYGFYVADF